MHRISYISIVMLLIFGMFGCTKVVDTVSLEEYGSLSGRVRMFGENGFIIPNEQATIRIEGTDFTTTSDNNGFYEFTDIPTGTYNISYKSSSTEEYLRQGVIVSVGTNPVLLKDVVLGQKPLSSVSNLRIEPAGFTQKIIGDIDPPGGETKYTAKTVYFFVSDDNNVSSENYVYYYAVSTRTNTFEASSGSMNFYTKIPDADTAYIRAYAVTPAPEHFKFSVNTDEYGIETEQSFIPSDTGTNVIAFPIN